MGLSLPLDPPLPVEGYECLPPSLPSFPASLQLLRSGRLKGAAFWKLICSLILTQHPAWHKLFRVMINKDAGRHWGLGEKQRPCEQSFLTFVNVQPG